MIKPIIALESADQFGRRIIVPDRPPPVFYTCQFCKGSGLIPREWVDGKRVYDIQSCRCCGGEGIVQ